jgi:acyl transferase domain-containing protein
MTPHAVARPVASTTDIAVIGVSGYYPGSTDMDGFWETLRSGADRVTEIPADRWDWRPYYDRHRGQDQKSYGKWGAFLDEVEGFDAEFFDILPSAAEIMDPQERLFLETAWNLLEETGYLGAATHETSTGVFVGVMYETYGRIGATAWSKGRLAGADSAPWLLANQVSYQFDFQGPSYAVSSACSSSLTAVHLACDSLRHGECRMAIAGGANLILHPAHLAALAAKNMLSPDGRCKAFDARANGFVPGEGVGAVLLKPLAAAEAENDRIWGVIKASFVNAAGRTSGFTVPNPAAQADLIAEAIRRAGIEPETISYVEAHGTGTTLGDPIEMAGIKAALARGAGGDARAERQRCAVGSVKANIGHLEGAAGIAGLTKLLLQLKHRQIAPCINLDKVNPMIDTGAGRLYFPSELMEWTTDHGVPRRGGVSSFGAGGAGAHLIVEEYVRERPSVEATADADGDGDLFLLSARTPQQLLTLAERTADLLGRADAPGLRSLACMSAVRRKEMPVRLAVLASTNEELRSGLHAFLDDRASPRVCYGTAAPGHALDKDAVPVIAATRQRGHLPELARMWTQGALVDWTPLWPDPRPLPVALPPYPFARKRYWIPAEDQRESASAQAGPAQPDEQVGGRAPASAPAPLRLTIERELRSIATRFLRVAEQEVDADTDLVELGFDSISLVQLVGELVEEYEIDVDAAVDAVLFEHLSLGALAGHIEQHYHPAMSRELRGCTTMTDTAALRLLSPDEVAARLRTSPGGGRGFLGTDPVIQNDALLARALRDTSARLLGWRDTVLGTRPNPRNPRQEEVAATSNDADALAALLDFLRAHRHCGSALAVCGPDAAMLPALNQLGFRRTGLLRGHYFRAGRYLDATVHYRDLERP